MSVPSPPPPPLSPTFLYTVELVALLAARAEQVGWARRGAGRGAWVFWAGRGARGRGGAGVHVGTDARFVYAHQLDNRADSFTKCTTDRLAASDIAHAELAEGRLPLRIARRAPNGARVIVKGTSQQPY